MTTRKICFILLLMAGALLLGACGRKEAQNDRPTPKDAVECTMESLKNLDLTAFNNYTDNYIQTEYNWLGVPARMEYHVFNELLQLGSKSGKRYKFNYDFAQKTMEHLSWEITDIRESDSTAEIDLEITNIDMRNVMGDFTVHILENMIDSEGTGIIQFTKDMSTLTDDKSELLSILDSHSADTCTMAVTVSAYRENGQWKIHVSDAFINAFMGNIDAETFPGDIEQRIAELEKQYEEKMDDWAENLENRIEKWTEKLAY